MEWTPGGQSEDVEDRRSESGGGGGSGGGGFGGVHLGIGGVIVVGLLSLVFQQNFFQFFSGGAPGAAVARPDPTRDGAEKTRAEFASFVLDDVQKTWDQTLPAQTQRPYHHAKMVLYRDEYPSACGEAGSSTGPFYCPGDEKVYLDLGFFDELQSRFGATGQFAQAYVIAHEIGHHVQHILGIDAKVRQLQQRSREEVNPLSVRLELQADCFAGIWANSTRQRGLIDDQDIQSGLSAAAAVGDDRIQKAAQGVVHPESFTHGTSAQRMQWFRAGLESGRIDGCQTFGQ
jgi:predicted metalloprotease